jgi:hypothetical protein
MNLPTGNSTGFELNGDEGFGLGVLKESSSYFPTIARINAITPCFAGFRGDCIPNLSIPGIGSSLNISLFSRSLSSSKIRL